MAVRRLVGVGTVAGVLVLGVGLFAARRPVRPSPADVGFSVRVARTPAVFAVGEQVPLDLEFSGSGVAGLVVPMNTRGHLGPTQYERYRVEPGEGVVDLSIGGPSPSADEQDGGGGFAGYHQFDDSRTTVTVRAVLNDWIRFRRAGHYVVSVESTRVRQGMGRTAAVPVPPARFELDIVEASAEWARLELDRALEAIATRRIDRVSEGVAILEYLGTREAAVALVDHAEVLSAMGAGRQVWNGLLTTPDQAFVRDLLRARLEAGDPSVGSVLHVLARLDARAGRGGSAVDADGTVDNQALTRDLRRQWIWSVVSKPPTPARFAALLSVVSTRPEDRDVTMLALSRLDAAPEVAREAFAVARPPVQRYLVTDAWPLVDRAWARVALNDAYSRPPATGDFFDDGWTRDAMLKRILQIEPAEGRRLILDELRTGSRRIGDDVLSSLPDRRLPELDEALVSRLRDGLRDEPNTTDRAGRAAWSIARYASGAVLDDVRTLLAVDHDSDTEAALLVYLFEFDPAEAMRRLEAPCAPDASCRRPPFSTIARRYWDPRFELAVIRALGGDDADVAAEAASLLGEKGSPAAWDPLLARLGRLHEDWRLRVDELERLALTSDGPARLETTLTSTLFLGASRWGHSREELTRVAALCLTDRCRKDAARRLSIR